MMSKGKTIDIPNWKKTPKVNGLVVYSNFTSYSWQQAFVLMMILQLDALGDFPRQLRENGRALVEVVTDKATPRTNGLFMLSRRAGYYAHNGKEFPGKLTP